MRNKSDAFSAFQQYLAYAERHTGRKLKCLHEDKGGEWMSKEMERFCADRGIRRERTVRAEPHQNGVGERPNRTLGEAVVSMLVEASLSPSF